MSSRLKRGINLVDLENIGRKPFYAQLLYLYLGTINLPSF